jgi:hypothetical protein
MNTSILLLPPLLALFASCGPFIDIRERLEPDVSPPLLLGIRAVSETEVEIAFDEPPCCQPESIRTDPPLQLAAVRSEGCTLILYLAGQLPGRPYRLEAVVEDEKGNGLHFLALFYGFNPDVPELLINEFTTRGTGNHPDTVELKAVAGGNMGGLVIYEGTPGNFDDRLVFPAFEVQAGDFLLVHFKPQDVPEEIDETEDKAASGGLDASELAYDFWVPAGSGISGNNGVISLYERPGGKILDGVLYSNRTSDSDQSCGGFGTRDSLERAEELTADGGWQITGERVRPEDALSPEGSTGTRSLCRDRASTDTDSAADWHIVPTLGFTFGMENSDEVYAP